MSVSQKDRGRGFAGENRGVHLEKSMETKLEILKLKTIWSCLLKKD